MHGWRYLDGSDTTRGYLHACKSGKAHSAMAEKAQATYGDPASAMSQTAAMGQQKKNSTRAKVARVKSRQLRRTIYMCVMALNSLTSLSFNAPNELRLAMHV